MSDNAAVIGPDGIKPGKWTTVVEALTPAQERSLVEQVRSAVDAYQSVVTQLSADTTYAELGGAISHIFEAAKQREPSADATRQEIADRLVAIVDQARGALKTEVDQSLENEGAREGAKRATAARYQQVLGLIGCEDKPTAFCMALRR